MKSLHLIEDHLLKLSKLLCLTPVELNENATFASQGYEISTNLLSGYELGETIEAYFKFTIDIFDISDNFFSFKDDATSGQIISQARLLEYREPKLFELIILNRGKKEPVLTYNGVKMAADHLE